MAGAYNRLTWVPDALSKVHLSSLAFRVFRVDGAALSRIIGISVLGHATCGVARKCGLMSAQSTECVDRA